MSILLRPDSDSPTNRAEYWQHTLSESICPVEVRTGCDLHSPDQLVLHEAGPVLASDVSMSGPGEAIRTWRHVRTSDPDFWKVDLLVDGSGYLEQDDRQALLRAGDFALVDVRRPARWAVSAHRVIGLMFPRTLLPLSSDDVANAYRMRPTSAARSATRTACRPSNIDALARKGQPCRLSEPCTRGQEACA
jgi:hypothetical protein